jgi:hypothetical protein
MSFDVRDTFLDLAPEYQPALSTLPPGEDAGLYASHAGMNVDPSEANIPEHEQLVAEDMVNG